MNRLSWIFIAITAGILILLGIFILRPQVSSSWKAYQEARQADENLKNVVRKKEVLSELSNNNKLNSLFDIASKYIPENQQSGELVIELSAIANQSNLKVEQVQLDSNESAAANANSEENAETETDNKPTETQNTTPNTNSNDDNNSTQQIAFSLKLSGSYGDFQNFLKNVETSSRLITLSKITITAQNDSFSIDLSGNAYFKNKLSLEKNLENIVISKDVIAKFENLKTYGTPIDLPTESGFGRTDPFDPIK